MVTPVQGISQQSEWRVQNE